MTREKRKEIHKADIFDTLNDYKQQEFLKFVLSQYAQEGVEELEREKLPQAT